MPVLQGHQAPKVEALLAWYDANQRVLPWRARAGSRADPYQVWLSEIMLQQTTVQAVDRYYRAFLARWPTVEHLAAASLDEVLAAWAGLGYYARARNLHRTAKIVAGQMAGRFPGTAAGLRALPGIGPYTAGAIAAIAFDEPQAAVDANAERVIARLFLIETPLPAAKTDLRTRTQALVPQRRAGDFAQALMDLGAMICTPRAPQCPRCPWRRACVGRASGLAETLPRKIAKRDRPLKRGVAFVAVDANGAVLLQRRAEEGLLGGMMQPPLGPWAAEFPTELEALAQAPFAAAWKRRPGHVHHQFTHFELEIEVYFARLARRPRTKGQWVQRKGLADAALPTVMRKILGHGLGVRTEAPA
jgi:A/G-specific adenine glycosylase